MQGLNGVQIYQILKALDKNVKILFISGLDSAEEIISVLPNVTLNDIIKKPIEADRLNQIIRSALLSY
jgi:DNA-binding response OmpR family regulator